MKTKSKIMWLAVITFLLFLPHDSEATPNTFDQIIHDAAQTSSKLKAISNKKEALKFNKQQASASLFPNASFFIRDENSIIKESTSPYLRSLGITSYDKSYGINYQLKLYDRNLFNIVSLAHRSFDLNSHKNQKEEYRATNELKIALLKYILSTYRVKSLENSLIKAQTASKEADLGFQLGTKTKVDVLRAQANLMSLKSETTRAKLEKINARSAFLALNDIDQIRLEYFENLDEDSLQNELNLNLNLEKQIKSFLDNARDKNNDLKELILEENFLLKEKDQINASNFPTLRLEGSYQNQESTYANLLSSPSRSHTIALVAEIPISLGGQLFSQSLERHYAIRSLQYEILSKRKVAIQKTANSKLNIESLIDLTKSLKINAEQFDELYRLTAISYKLGKASLLELLDVQDNLLTAKFRYQENCISLLNELFEDEILTGSSLETL